MFNTITKVHAALYLSEICDTDDINSLLLGKCDIGRWLLGNQVVAHGNQWHNWNLWGQFRGGRYDYIFLSMNDKDNIGHYTVAREVWVTIATKIFPRHEPDCLPFQNGLIWSKESLYQISCFYRKMYDGSCSTSLAAPLCEVAGKSLILDGCLKKSFFGHPSHIDDFPCNLTQFCYIPLLLLPLQTTLPSLHYFYYTPSHLETGCWVTASSM